MKRGEKPRMEDYESKHQYPSQTIVRILLRTFPSQQGRDGLILEYLFLFFSALGRKLMNSNYYLFRNYVFTASPVKYQTNLG